MAIKSAPVPMMTCAMSAGLHLGRGDTMLFAAIDKVVVGREGRAVIVESDGWVGRQTEESVCKRYLA